MESFSSILASISAYVLLNDWNISYWKSVPQNILMPYLCFLFNLWHKHSRIFIRFLFIGCIHIFLKPNYFLFQALLHFFNVTWVQMVVLFILQNKYKSHTNHKAVGELSRWISWLIYTILAQKQQIKHFHMVLH